MRIHLFRLALTILIAAPLTCAANLELTFKGTGSIRGSFAASERGYQTRQGPAMDAHFTKQASGNNSPARVPSASVPRPAASSPVGSTRLSDIAPLENRGCGPRCSKGHNQHLMFR